MYYNLFLVYFKYMVIKKKITSSGKFILYKAYITVKMK